MTLVEDPHCGSTYKLPIFSLDKVVGLVAPTLRLIVPSPDKKFQLYVSNPGFLQTTINSNFTIFQLYRQAPSSTVKRRQAPSSAVKRRQAPSGAVIDTDQLLALMSN